MNSIDTLFPTLLPLIDSEEGVSMPSMAAPDAAALEALRAMMGGCAPPPLVAAFGAPSPASSKSSAATLPAVLEQLLKSDGLPAALVPLLTSLRGNVQKGGTTQSDPALIAEIKTLLSNIVAVRPDTPHSSPLSVPLPVRTQAVPISHLVHGAGPVAAQTPEFVLPGPGIANNTLPSSASPQPLNTQEPADLSSLAQALLQILNDTPQSNSGGVVMPSFASLIEDEPATSSDRSADTPNLGSSILQSLGHQSTPASSVQASDKGAPAGAVERVTEVSNLITQMADRVLVTDPLHGQTQEVRIKIADNVMQDTEVRVWREDGGALRVEFDTASAYWSRILNDASPLLSQRLNERLPSGTEAQVTVTVQQQGQQPEDGRSRNRQNPWELAQQAQES